MTKLISMNNPSNAWFTAKDYILGQSNLECNNLIVHFKFPLQLCDSIHNSYSNFCMDNNLNEPNKVAATIFPKRTYHILNRDRQKLYKKYHRIHKVVKGTWGSYFQQMIGWKDSGGKVINQIEEIINMMNDRDRTYKTSYMIQISNPIRHFGWPRGLPCLQKVFVQLDGPSRKMSLLSVYRNHDFGEKAYGNYMGLGHLLEFLAYETGFEIGEVTCVSSHAFIDRRHKHSLQAIRSLGGTDE